MLAPRIPHAARAAPATRSASQVHATVHGDRWSVRLAIVATCTRVRLTGIPSPNISSRPRPQRRPVTSTTRLPGITITLRAAAHVFAATERASEPATRGKVIAAKTHAPKATAKLDAPRRDPDPD